MNRRSFLAAVGATGGAGVVTETRLAHRVRATAERFEFGLRFNDLGDMTDRYTAATALDSNARAVVAAAVDDGYETRDVPDWLRRFLHETRLVRVHGTFYELDYAVPTYVVRPERVAERDADGPIASADAYEEARTTDWGVGCGVTCPRDGGDGYATLRTPWLRPKMRAFLHEYEYVRYGGDVVYIPLAVDDPGPPYTLTTRRVDEATVVGGPVLALDEVPAAHRETLRAAAVAPGAAGANGLPDSLVERLRDAEYLRIDGTYYTTYTSDVRAIPLDVSVSVTDPTLAPFDPAPFDLTLGNVGDRSVEVFSGPPMPFSVLSVHRADDPEPRHVVWSDAYRETGHVSTFGRRVLSVTGVGTVVTLAPGESRTTTYELGGVGPGTWLIDDSVGGAFADEPDDGAGGGGDDARGDSDGGAGSGRDGDAGSENDVGNGDVPFRVRFEVS